MFAFRSTHPKRKEPQHGNKKDSHGSATKSRMTPKRGMNIFVATRTPSPHQQADDASLDMSLYTTQSKSTIRYMSTSGKMSALGHSWQQQREYYLRGGGDVVPDDDATEYTTERALKQAGYHKDRLLTPATDPLSTPTSALGDVDDEVSSIGADDSSTELFATAKMARFQFPKGTMLPSEPHEEERSHKDVVDVVSEASSTSSSSSSYGHYEYDRSQNESKRDEYTGPVDLDESIADTLSLASSSNSWVLSAMSGMASPQIYSTSMLVAEENDQSHEWEQEEDVFSGVHALLATPTIYSHHSDDESIHSATSSSTGQSETSSSSSSWPSSPPPSMSSKPGIGIEDEASLEDNPLLPFLSKDEEEEVSSQEQQGCQQVPQQGNVLKEVHQRGKWSQEDEDAVSLWQAQTTESIHNGNKSPMMDQGSPHRSLDEEEDDLQSMLWDGSPGTLRLTEHELKRHMGKTLFPSTGSQDIITSTQQDARGEPNSSSAWLNGYEDWKRMKECQDRYYAKLQKNAEERQRERREKEQQQQRQMLQRQQDQQLQQQTRTLIEEEGHAAATPKNTRMQHSTNRVDVNQRRNGRHPTIMMQNSTRSAMDQSVDSSIPTLDEASLIPRKKGTQTKKEPRRRKWNIFSRLSPKKKKEKKAGSRKKADEATKALPALGPTTNQRRRVSHNAEDVLPLGQFFHPSDGNGEDNDSFGGGDWTCLLDSPTIDSSRLESLGGNVVSDPVLVQKRLEKQRQAIQRQAEEARVTQEIEERKRIEQRKMKELERQRRLNLPSKNLPPKPVVNHNSHTGKLGRKLAEEYAAQRLKKTPSKDGDSTQSPSEGDSVLEKSFSVCSKESAFSSLQEESKTSSKLLAPCILCNAAERSHIAMPCMHFSFCGGCVRQIHDAEPGGAHCPVCNTGNIAFSKVFTD